MGATEGAPASGAADLIVDLASSGATLIQNHLKELDDGVILRSQACLVACASPAVWNEARLSRLTRVVEMLESRLAARGFFVLRFYSNGADTSEILSELRGTEFGCEVLDESAQGGSESGERAVLCPRGRLYEASRRLRDRGCRGVTAVTPDFVFRPHSSTIEGFRATLAQRSMI
jgi:ATP phosphoribosyltransferase